MKKINIPRYGNVWVNQLTNSILSIIPEKGINEDNLISQMFVYNGLRNDRTLEYLGMMKRANLIYSKDGMLFKSVVSVPEIKPKTQQTTEEEFNFDSPTPFTDSVKERQKKKGK